LICGISGSKSCRNAGTSTTAYIRAPTNSRKRQKHAESIDDQLILTLVKELDGRTFPIEEVHGEFQYFTVQRVVSADKPYRMVLLICMTDDYLGVINAFRVERRPK